MIKQFNFYDIYGYLLPGVLLLSFVLFPFALFGHGWVEQDISKAVFVGLLAYVLGLLVQTVGAVLVPSKVMDKEGNRRAISEYVLDAENKTFSAELKARLEAQVAKLFGLTLNVQVDGEANAGVRQNAFFQARAYLIAKKAASYAEQFEGLYAMMRGLGCSFCAGAAYLAGWGIGLNRLPATVVLVMKVVSVTLAAGTLWSAWDENYRKVKPARSGKPRRGAIEWGRGLWLGLLGVSGYWASAALARGAAVVAHPRALVWAGVLAALIAAAKCFQSYRGFAESFATTVWRDFSASISLGGAEKPAGAKEDDGEES